MLINDFFKLSVATFPNDNLAKMATNRIFITKTTRKNDRDIFLRNNGMATENADVAITHEKMIIRKLTGLIDWFIVGNPACSYSSPYFTINNQKCGICQIKRKNAIKTIVDSNI